MMVRVLYVTLFLCIILTGCKDSSEVIIHSKPKCEFTSLSEGYEIKKGAIFDIITYVYDSISELSQVTYNIAGVEIVPDYVFPYCYYKWDTKNAEIGNNVIQVYAENKLGGNCSISINVVITEIDYGEITDFDGNDYRTIQLGRQEWMAENLYVTKLNTGEEITYVSGNNEWSSGLSKKYCWYNNNYEDYGINYGALYNLFSVSSDKLCPLGWHVPTIEDWNELFEFASMDGLSDYEGFLLRATDYWGERAKGMDYYGFKGLPGGSRYNDGLFGEENGYWWSSTIFGEHGGKAVIMNRSNPSLVIFESYPEAGFSVRCIKD